MWFAYLYRRAEDATQWIPDPDEVAAATTEADCVTALLAPPWDVTYELGVDALPPPIADIRPQIRVPVPRLFARVDTDTLGTPPYEYVGVIENPDAPAPLPPNPLPREPLEEHSVQAVHLLPAVGTPGQLLALDGSQELVWQDPGTTGLEDGSVTTPKLAANAVTADKIVDGTITGAEVAAGTITADKLAAGVIPAPPGMASDSTPGLIQIATTADVQAGTDTLKAITPGRLGGRTATETRTGLVELATTAEAVAGTDTIRAVTPAGVEARIVAMPVIPTASEATAGLVRLASQAEVTAGTDDSKALTPLKLATRLVNASETQRGLLELATQAEVTAGTNDLTAVTPLTLQQRLTDVLPGAATTTVAGVLELATTAEVTTGTDTTRAVTPAGLAAKLPAGTPYSVVRYAAGGTALEAAPGVTVEASGSLNVTDKATTRTNLELGTASDVQFNRLGLGRAASPAARLVFQPEIASKLLLYGDVISLRNGLGISTGVFQVFSHGTGRIDLGAMSITDGVTFTPHLTIVGSTGRVGVGTTLASTLGAGATYQPLTMSGSLLTVGQSSVQERPQALVNSTWVVSTDATRTARLTLSAYDHLAAREGLRIEADGTGPRLGVLGAAAVGRQSVPAAAADAATTQALANSLRQALLNFGFCV